MCELVRNYKIPNDCKKYDKQKGLYFPFGLEDRRIQGLFMGSLYGSKHLSIFITNLQNESPLTSPSCFASFPCIFFPISAGENPLRESIQAESIDYNLGEQLAIVEERCVKCWKVVTSSEQRHFSFLLRDCSIKIYC